jgi:hypothetical protein
MTIVARTMTIAGWNDHLHGAHYSSAEISAETLEAIAGVDEVSVNEEIRRAIAAHIEARRRDVDFHTRLEASIERNKEILERLAR